MLDFVNIATKRGLAVGKIEFWGFRGAVNYLVIFGYGYFHGMNNLTFCNRDYFMNYVVLLRWGYLAHGGWIWKRWGLIGGFQTQPQSLFPSRVPSTHHPNYLFHAKMFLNIVCTHVTDTSWEKRKCLVPPTIPTPSSTLKFFQVESIEYR